MRPTPTTRTTEKQQLLRLPNGELVDARTREAVPVEDLAAGLGSGQRFTVSDERTGRRCTYSVIAEAIRSRADRFDDPMLAGLLRAATASHANLKPATTSKDRND